MTGIVIVTHGNLGSTLIDTLEMIMGQSQENLISISIDIQQDPDNLRKRIKKGIGQVKSDNGVIILTDMFGGTPSNLSYSFLEEGQVEVISGVNLPILMKAVNSRKKMSMEQLTTTLITHGKRSISLASDILKGPAG